MMSTETATDDGRVFSNEPIDVAGLPRLSEETFQPLDPRFLRIRWAADGIVALLVIVAAVVVTVALPESSPVPGWVPPLVGVALLALVGLTAWLQMVEVAHLGYLVREKDFSFRKGVISRSVTTVPFARIQHVSIDRGPLARRFGLATLQMRTAGDGLTVPGIGHEAAQQLKALVVDRAGVAADEELAEGAAAAVSRPAAPPPAAPAPVSGPAEPAGPTELR